LPWRRQHGPQGHSTSALSKRLGRDRRGVSVGSGCGCLGGQVCKPCPDLREVTACARKGYLYRERQWDGDRGGLGYLLYVSGQAGQWGRFSGRPGFPGCSSPGGPREEAVQWRPWGPHPDKRLCRGRGVRCWAPLLLHWALHPAFCKACVLAPRWVLPSGSLLLSPTPVITPCSSPPHAPSLLASLTFDTCSL
jgi:hypothetical protein